MYLGIAVGTSGVKAVLSSRRPGTLASRATGSSNRAGADGLVARAPGETATASIRMRSEAIA